jgi:hypothetical protein
LPAFMLLRIIIAIFMNLKQIDLQQMPTCRDDSPLACLPKTKGPWL